MTPAELKRAIQLDYALSDRLASRSYIDYLKRVVIDSRPQPRRFGDVARPFQWNFANALAPAVEYIAGVRPSYDGPLSFGFIMPKGSDKTGSVGRLLNWMLGYSKRRLNIYAAAADTDQAKLVKDSQATELRLNPWLANRVTLLNRVAWGRGGHLEILASDAGSAQGKLPDILAYDEIVHWHQNSKPFFDALYSARNKRPACLTIVTSNAGWKGTWAWDLRQEVINSPRWHWYEAPEGSRSASWMNAAAIAEDRKLLHPSEAARLLDNKWIDLAEERGFIAGIEVDGCVFTVTDPPPGSRVYLGVDYGPTRDRTAVALLHRAADGILEVSRLECWHRPGGRVRVEEIEAAVAAIKLKWPDCHIVCDPYQMESSIQQWEAKRWEVQRFEPRSGKGNYAMAANLHSLITSRRIRWAEKAGAVTLPKPFNAAAEPLPSFSDDFTLELKELIIRPSGTGYRIDHTSGRHDDRSVAVGMAALAATNDNLPTPFVAPEPLSLPNSERDLRSLDFSRGRQLYGG